MRSVYIYPGGGEFGEECARLARSMGFSVVAQPAGATLALAPLLTRVLRPAAIAAPQLGTLVFHPSALPYHRGPDAIRWTLAAGERVSAATWFWADEGLDTGPICEQELVILAPGESAGRAYHTRFQPAALVALRRALRGVLDGRPRRVPQDERLASYESFYGRPVEA